MDKVRVYAADLLSNLTDRQYSLIVSNPPFHAGKSIDYSITTAMIQQAHRVLTPNGRMIIVANRFIRYEQVLKQYFPKVSVLAQNNRFHVLEATRDYNLHDYE